MELEFDIEPDEHGVFDGMELAGKLIAKAYKLLAPYAGFCPGCTDALFAKVARKVTNEIYEEGKTCNQVPSALMAVEGASEDAKTAHLAKARAATREIDQEDKGKYGWYFMPAGPPRGHDLKGVDEHIGVTGPLIPEIIAEWETVEKQVSDLVARRRENEDTGETVRIMVDLPKEWAILAAWLELIGYLRSTGKARAIGFPINIEGKGAEKTGARRHVLRILDSYFHDELHRLSIGTHGFFFQQAARAAPAPEDFSDDEIPF